MRPNPSFLTASLVVALLTACADSAPTALDRAASAPQWTVTDATGTEIELRRPRIEVTGWTDLTTTVSPDLATPQAARNIGPGSAILITIPDEGRFGCTANFVWRDGSNLYLGAAGHCFLPADRKSTHGAGADYNAAGVTVQVCVENCEGNFRTAGLVGQLVTLGRVAYARQSDPTGEEDVGNDFGVVEIPASAAHLVRPEMPVWGGPKGVMELETGSLGCHYGNGLLVGEVFLTKARTGVGGGSDRDSWMGDFAAAFGDSGSALNGCASTGLRIYGTGAVGVLTHIGVAACPCDVNFKNQKFKAVHGVVFGTTVRRAIGMAAEAGMRLSIVEP